LNGDDHYTIFDVPISVTNKIDSTGNNPPCDSLDNPLLTPEQIDADAANAVGILFAPGDATVVEQTDLSSDDAEGLGPTNADGSPAGLGSGANNVDGHPGALWIPSLLVAIVCIL
jgi:hypothetical protein